jgi:hypothetical protein
MNITSFMAVLNCLFNTFTAKSMSNMKTRHAAVKTDPHGGWNYFKIALALGPDAA